VDLRSGDAQHPEQVGSGYAVKIPDADHQARERTAPSEFVCLRAADAEDLRSGHQVDGGGQASELADSQRDGVDGILLREFDWVIG
jgi:hypothetical protein